jgi:signal transduction histidine kinase/CheY-like chemotaxis protein
LQTGVFQIHNQPNENELLCADGSIKIVGTSYFVVPSNNGYILYSIIRDITKLRKNQKELIQSKEKAEESDKLKTAFLNNISHEVRTPLNTICGFSEIIANTCQSNDKLKKFSTIISDSSIKLMEIITDVIEISKLQSKQIALNESDFDFIELVNEIEYQFEPIIKLKALGFSIQMKPGLSSFKIYSDRNKIFKIFRHLIDNAIKFTYKGQISINLSFQDDKIDIIISDTGIGITKEMQEIIFESFRQVEIGISRDFGGNGVGLAIVKDFVNMLGGTIKLESEINKGSPFFISIPVQTQIEPSEDNNYDQKTKIYADTILIIDDEQGNFEFLSEVLEGYCKNILHAVNGQQAVELCKVNSQINLILMDIKMPVMDGYTATKLIKVFRPELIIIAQSAYINEDQKTKLFENGFSAYVCKPIQIDTLYTTIDRFVCR